MDTSTTVTYTLSLHDALPICICRLAFSFIERLVGQRVGFAILLAIHVVDPERVKRLRHFLRAFVERLRSEEHTSELQSHVNLVCRLLLEKKKERIYTADVRTT